MAVVMNDLIAAKCPSCSTDLRVRREYAGHKVSCKSCGSVFAIPAPGETPAASATDALAGSGRGGVNPVAAQPPPEGTELVRFACPNCGKSLKMRRDQVGATVSCKKCEHVFKTSAATLAAGIPAPAPDAVKRPNDAAPATFGTPAPDWKARVDSLETENSSLRVERDGLRAEIERVRELSETLRDEAASPGGAKSPPEPELSRDIPGGIPSARAEMIELLAGREQESVAHEALVARLSDDLRAAASRQEIADSRLQELEGLREDVEALKREHEVETRRLREEAASGREKWEAEHRAAEAATEDLRRAARDEVEASKVETEVLRRRVEEIQASRNVEVDELRTELARLRAEMATTRAESDALNAELGQLHAELATLTEHHAGSVSEWEGREELHREAVGTHQSEIARLQTECKSFSDKLDELLDDIERERSARGSEQRAHEEQLAAVRQDWESERLSLAQERDRAAIGARAAQEEHDRIIAGLNDRLRESTDRLERVRVESERPDPLRSQLEAQLAEKSGEVEELRLALLQAQTFRTQMGTFLSGLGIRLPN